jgi:hypothetical protein
MGVYHVGRQQNSEYCGWHVMYSHYVFTAVHIQLYTWLLCLLVLIVYLIFVEKKIVDSRSL